MKRFSALALAGLLLLGLLAVFALPGFAADITARMMQGDDAQDALLVGKVIEVGGDFVLFDVVRTVSGKPAKSPFRLEPEGWMLQSDSWARSAFDVDDGILVSVRYAPGSRTTGTVVYRAFKVELKQDKKIKMSVNEYDVGFIEWYVNTGERFMTGNGNAVSRYDEGSTEKQLIFDGEKWLMDSLDAKYKAPEVNREPTKPLLANFTASFTTKQVLSIFAGCAAFGLISISVMAVVIRKRRKKRIQQSFGE